MDSNTRAVRLARWKNIVQQCQARPQGQTIAQWLDAQGISRNAYFYWQRLVRKDAYAKMKAVSAPDVSPASALPAPQSDADVTFAEIPVPRATCETEQCSFRPEAVLEIGNVTVKLTNAVSPSLLSGIMEAIRHAR